MSAEELKATIRRVAEGAYNRGDLVAMDECYSAEFIYHRVPLPDIVGLEAYKRAIIDVRNSFSDVQLRFDEIIIEGDVIATRWTFGGKHLGQSPTIPIPPTNKQVTITGCSVTHTVGGKALEEWNYADWLGFFQQLGVVPPLELGGK